MKENKRVIHAVGLGHEMKCRGTADTAPGVADTYRRGIDVTDSTHRGAPSAMTGAA